MKRNAIVVTAIVVTSVVLTNGLQFFISSKLNSRTEAKYKSQIEQLNSTLEEIGPLEDVYTISDKAKKITAGTIVLDSDLKDIKMPKSCIHDNFILDKYDVVGKFYKIALSNGTPLTKDMFMEKELDNTSRAMDITADVFPIGLKVGDYVDYRLLYPKGEDYIVISHLRVDEINGSTVKVVLNEQDLLFYDSAVVENFLNTNKGSMTYLAKYTEPGVQEKAKITYSVPQNIMNLLDKNPNIVANIQNGSVNRDTIDSATQSIGNDTAGALQSGRSSMIAKYQSARSLYDNVQAQKKEEEAVSSESGDNGKSSFGATDANGQPVDLNTGKQVSDNSTSKDSKNSTPTKISSGGVE